MNVYQENWSSWADVVRDFQVEVPEPEEVLVAWYGYESFEGSAVVVYRNGNMFYVVEGSHCSCYGLEDNWNPEAFEGSALIHDYLTVKVKNDDWNYERNNAWKTALENLTCG